MNKKGILEEADIKASIAHFFLLMHRQQYFRDGNTRTSFYLLFYFLHALKYRVTSIKTVLDQLPMWQGNTKADPTQIQCYLQGMKLESAKEMTPAEAQAIYTAINKDWNP